MNAFCKHILYMLRGSLSVNLGACFSFRFVRMSQVRDSGGLSLEGTCACAGRYLSASAGRYLPANWSVYFVAGHAPLLTCHNQSTNKPTGQLTTELTNEPKIVLTHTINPSKYQPSESTKQTNKQIRKTTGQLTNLQTKQDSNKARKRQYKKATKQAEKGTTEQRLIRSPNYFTSHSL